MERNLFMGPPGPNTNAGTGSNPRTISDLENEPEVVQLDPELGTNEPKVDQFEPELSFK
ncbi:hypothetical protein C2G38_2206319 [Gigaspora rosea]|uniref:Uncharacterized protein n=1 Tax=Gigaspora rosea TaxID=44941 RepID=A0A397UM85_9GLOM|nr:hypothetical protein C2G38_2206319 [Gigaspora rosea]